MASLSHQKMVLYELGHRWKAAPPNSVKQAWDRARTRVCLSYLYLHDLRHQAASRLAERLNVLELAAITGHRDLRMLQRYTHLSPESLASKIG